MTNGRQTSADLIDAVVENMRQNLETLKFATLAPSRYTVYLSPARYARLEGIVPRLQAEAIRALDEELARLNRPAWLRRRLTWLPGRRRAPLENAGPRWHVEFLCDADGELASEAISSFIPISCWRLIRRSASVNERADHDGPTGDHTMSREQVVGLA